MYDLVLAGGLIVDGKRTKPYTANLCIQDGRIAKITTEAVSAAETLDVTGLAVAPGFIDIHSHSDVVPFLDRTPQGKILQGVTTEVIGNCGSSILPSPEGDRTLHEEFCQAKKHHPGFASVTEYADAVNAVGHVCNCMPLLGHGNLRVSVMGFVNRDPDEKEMEQLKAVLEREMQRGTPGMSLGLIYPPSAFSAKEELIELSRIIAKYDGILAVHMRNEGPRLFEAVDEMIEIAEKSGVHVQISHLKLMGAPQWGKAPQLIAKLDEARARGLNITADQYPFPASSTSLTALVPHWAHEGGYAALTARVEAREGNICEGILKEMTNRGGPDTIMVDSHSHSDTDYRGKFIGQIAKELGLDPVEAVRKVLLDTKCSAHCIYFCINEEDIRYIMKQDYVCVGSDGTARNYDCAGNPHPRNFATFPQYFQTVREHNILPLEDMVYKATALTASILGIRDRGTLEEGMWADVTVFDPENFASRSTFLAPKAQPAGLVHVVVNGVIAVRNGDLTGEAPGRAVLK